MELVLDNGSDSNSQRELYSRIRLERRDMVCHGADGQAFRR